MAQGSAEIIIIDCSGSMDYPPTKMTQARAATAAAIDVVRDGVGFAVVAGTSTAWPVFPPRRGAWRWRERTARRGPRPNRRSPGCRPTAAPRIGQWLGLARQIFAGYPAQLRHAILLTDGKNQHETPAQLAAELSQCEGTFSCDCSGVGTDWEVSEGLRTVSSPRCSARWISCRTRPRLAADFTAAMMENAMGKPGRRRLAAGVDAAARHAQVRQAGRARGRGPDRQAHPIGTGRWGAGDYPTGAWGPGESEQGTTMSASRSTPGAAWLSARKMLAARISLVTGSPSGGASGAKSSRAGLVRAIWTDDEALSTKINPRVAHYTGQAELAVAIQEGLEARKAGDEETATAKLGRAVALAHQSGNEDTAKLLAKVVDVVDVESGTVRLKKKVEDADEMALDTRSTKTVRVKK